MPNDLQGSVILVVEEEELVRTLLGRMLEKLGVVAWLARSGREAVEVYRHHSNQIALVLADTWLLGMDGPALLTAIRAIKPNVCCCFMSEDAAAETEDELRQQGAAEVFPKPFRLAQIGPTLQRLVNSYADAA